MRGSIYLYQIGMHRPSYINAILIQSCGRVVDQPCQWCCGAVLGPRPFPLCRQANGYFGGCCTNCKQPNYASQCTVRDGGDNAPMLANRGLPLAGGRGSRTATDTLLIEDNKPGATAQNAIVLAQVRTNFLSYIHQHISNYWQQPAYTQLVGGVSSTQI